MWMQVMELTKRKQLHRHILITFDGLRKQKVQCNIIRYQDRLKGDCPCLNCLLCRAWYTITGDSYVVDVTKVYSHGVAGYLVKYLAKAMQGGDREILYNRGIKRLWSCSRNWPRDTQMQRRGTVDKAWVRHSFAYGQNSWSDKLSITGRHHWALQQVGTNTALRLWAEREFNRYAHVYETLRSGSHHSGGRPLSNSLATTSRR